MQNLYVVIFCATKSHVLNCFIGWLWNWYGI
jgi:hypothetical protein